MCRNQKPILSFLDKKCSDYAFCWYKFFFFENCLSTLLENKAKGNLWSNLCRWRSRVKWNMQSTKWESKQGSKHSVEDNYIYITVNASSSYPLTKIVVPCPKKIPSAEKRSPCPKNLRFEQGGYLGDTLTVILRCNKRIAKLSSCADSEYF